MLDIPIKNPSKVEPTPSSSNAVLRTKIRCTQLSLSLPLHPDDLPKFRGAIAAHAGHQNELFHNHDNVKGGLHYRYPLIQYQVVDGKATVVGIAEGAEALRDWAETYEGRLQMDGQWHSAPILAQDSEVVEVGFTENFQTYRIENWIALNESKYQQWKQCPRMTDQIALFEKAIVGQVMSFARGIDWFLEQRLAAELLEISEPRWRKRSGTKLMVFDATIRLPITLPNGIGIGKGASLGFGRIVNSF